MVRLGLSALGKGQLPQPIHLKAPDELLLFLKFCVACWVTPCAPRGRLTAGARSRHSGLPLTRAGYKPQLYARASSDSLMPPTVFTLS